MGPEYGYMYQPREADSRWHDGLEVLGVVRSVITIHSCRRSTPDGTETRTSLLFDAFAHRDDELLCLHSEPDMHGPVLPSQPRSSTTSDEDSAWVTRLWPGVKSTDINQEHYTEFLRFADEKIKVFNSVCSEPSRFEDFSDALRLISLFQQEVNLTRQRAAELAASILPPVGCDAPVEGGDLVWHCVELAICLWATLDIRVIANTSCTPTCRAAPAMFPGQMSFLWLNDCPLQELIQENFGNRGQRRVKLTASTHVSTLDPRCTMAYLSQAYDFRPHWTSNLADHLKIDTDSRTITIYEHKIFLWNHLESARHRDMRDKTPILPPSVLSEAIDTLNVLFPFGDDATEALLRRAGKEISLYRLGNCTRGRQLEMSRYRHWRGELGEVAGVLAQPPRGRAQFLLDGEGTNSRDVWSFWTAIAFGTLAVLGVALGTYSAVYARKAFDVGLLQYQLALAQACAAENATDALPGFCS